MKYKKQNLIVLAFLISISAMAQVRFGVNGGINFSNQKIENELFDVVNFDYDTNAKVGAQVGLVANFELNNKWSFEPGINLTSRGYTFEENSALLDVEIKSKPLYLSFSLPILYNFDIGSSNLFIGAGPYVALGIGGKIDVEGDVANFDFVDDDTISYGDDNGDTYRSGDWGLLFTGGIFLTEELALSARYGLGIANIQPNGDSDNFVRNRSLELNLTYYFGF